MFDDILGKVDYDKRDFKNTLKQLFMDVYGMKTIRIELIMYSCNIVIKGNGYFQSGGQSIKDFARDHLFPLFKNTGKALIVLKDLDYDSGYLDVNIEWS